MIPVQLFSGNDEILLAEAVRAAIGEAVGDEPPDLAVENLEEAAYDADGEWTMAPLVDAAQTPPFLTSRRVVVGRDLARFSTQDAVAGLVEYLSDPLPTTALILVWNKGPKLQSRVGGVPKKLTEAVNAAGGSIVKVATPTGKAATGWFNDQIKASPVTIDPAGRKMLADHLGENANRLGSILLALEGRFGAGAKLTSADIEPFIGDQGGVPPWELTDAMADGNIALTLEKLQRMSGGGDRHPLATLSILTTHYGRIARLDGAPIGGEKEAAALLGMKGSTFPAKKGLSQCRRMGSERIRECMELIAVADLDLRGKTAADAGSVMEILVARLARLSR